MRTERVRTRSAPLNAVEAALFGRRAIRRYSDRVVDRDAIEHLLSVAVRAPSSMDAQPWSPVFPLVLGYPDEHPALTSRRTPEIIVWR